MLSPACRLIAKDGISSFIDHLLDEERFLIPWCTKPSQEHFAQSVTVVVIWQTAGCKLHCINYRTCYTVGWSPRWPCLNGAGISIAPPRRNVNFATWLESDDDDLLCVQPVFHVAYRRPSIIDDKLQYVIARSSQQSLAPVIYGVQFASSADQLISDD